MVKATTRLVVLLAGSAWITPVIAADPQYARSLAATCFTCHGTDGRGVGNVPPGLAGRDRNDLLKQLQEFRDGRRPSTVMHQYAKGYTDEQLQLIAGYFAAIIPGQAASAPIVK